MRKSRGDQLEEALQGRGTPDEELVALSRLADHCRRLGREPVDPAVPDRLARQLARRLGAPVPRRRPHPAPWILGLAAAAAAAVLLFPRPVTAPGPAASPRAPVAAPRAQATFAPVRGPWSVRLVPARAVFAPKEAVRLTLEIRNESRIPVEVWPYPPAVRTVARTVPAGAGGLVLPPGGTVRWQVSLGSASPGSHTARVGVRFHSPAGRFLGLRTAECTFQVGG
ncbi:MAG: hypothetical protein M0031_15460 [Thermaerobacter sp.]|nr:hypothetical protein [Thermaerobacter sp.]